MQNAKRIFLWNAIGSLVYLGCQWLLSILVARIAGFEDAGVLSIAMSVSATFQTVAIFGIRNFQVSDIDNVYAANDYVGFRNVTCLAAMLCCVLFSLFAGYRGNQLLAILFFMLFRVAESYSDVLYGILQKAGRLDIAGKCFALKGGVTLLAFLAIYLLSRSLWLALAAMAITSLATTFFIDLVAAKRQERFSPFPRPQKKTFLLARETWPLFVYLFLFSTLTTVPKLILENMYDEVTLGAYSSLFSIAVILQMATGYIYTPLVNTFAEHYKAHNIKKFIVTLLKVLGAMLLLTLLALLCCRLFGEFVFVLVFGESIRPFIYLFTAILLAVLLLSVLGLLFMLEIVIRDFKGLIISNVVGFLLCVAFTPYMIGKFGANGASIGLILAASAVTLLSCGFTLHKLFKNCRLEVIDK